MNKKVNLEEIRNKIIYTINNESPNNVKELVNIIKSEYNIDRNLIINEIIELENNKIIKLQDIKITKTKNIKSYILSSSSYWFWLNGGFIMLTIIGAYLIPPNYIPLSYIRILLASIAILFLPGYNLIKLLFPQKEINLIERLTLSLGSSIALIPLLGLLLNYTDWGLRLTPIILSTSALTMLLSITAIYREYNIIKQD